MTELLLSHTSRFTPGVLVFWGECCTKLCLLLSAMVTRHSNKNFKCCISARPICKNGVLISEPISLACDTQRVKMPYLLVFLTNTKIGFTFFWGPNRSKKMVTIGTECLFFP